MYGDIMAMLRLYYGQIWPYHGYREFISTYYSHIMADQIIALVSPYYGWAYYGSEYHARVYYDREYHGRVYYGNVCYGKGYHSRVWYGRGDYSRVYYAILQTETDTCKTKITFDDRVRKLSARSTTCIPLAFSLNIMSANT